MKWMGLNEIRRLFSDFFKQKEHLYLDSFSLVPKDDFSLLFINSGMAPMKKWFLNKQKPPCKRVVTVQRCLRTGDLKRVGLTDRHGTFFEMLGNFSFGDYFKRQAIFWAFEFVIDVLKIPREKLYVTVFEKDDEAFLIWQKEIGVESSHIIRLGKEDNFWEIGRGPCGPCSELYFDRGIEHGCKKADCGPGCECDRFIEFWNLVFSQYENVEEGKYVELEQKNIDTGMGLERIACILQGVNSIFEVDTIKKILKKVCEIARVQYGEEEETDRFVRIITDHVRSIVFLIFDGVLPSNEAGGYVLRRLIRRAYKSGKKLNIDGYFLGELAQTVAIENKTNNEDLIKNIEYIKQIILAEEMAFEKILVASEERLNFLLEKIEEEALLKKMEFVEDCFLKQTAGFLALEEETTSFFEILNKEVERLFSGFFDKKDDESHIKEFINQKEEIKKRLRKIFSEIENFDYILQEVYENSQINVKEIENKFEEIIIKLDVENLKKLDEQELTNEKLSAIKLVIEAKDLILNIISKVKDLLNEWVLQKVKKEKEYLLEGNFSETGFDDILAVVFKVAKFLKLDVEKEDFFKKRPIVNAKDAFKLCDTYGMPLDFLEEAAQERNILVDIDGVKELMEQQKNRAKSAACFKEIAWQKEEKKELEKILSTEFVGYETLECEARILYIKYDGTNKEEILAEIVFNKTPIYPTAAGQVSDFAKLFIKPTNEEVGFVINCKKLCSGQLVHTAKLLKRLTEKDVIKIVVDKNKRDAISKNHTAAHILQKVLIDRFGKHIKQAGQHINEKRLRFDFVHFGALNKKEIKEIENKVNEIIFKGLDVKTYNMKLSEAKKEEAIALFHDKYGETVRVVDVDVFSKEFCSGTHVKNTSEIGLFKILSEVSASSGVRRIEAITSGEILNYVQNLEESLNFACGVFKIKNHDELKQKVANVWDELKEKKEELSQVKIKLCENEFCNFLKDECYIIGKFKVVVYCEDILDKKELRLFADCLKNKEKNIVALFFVSFYDRKNILVICGEEAIKNNAMSDVIVKKLAEVVGEKGGGRKDFAMAGLKNFEKKEEIKREFFNILKNL